MDGNRLGKSNIRERSISQFGRYRRSLYIWENEMQTREERPNSKHADSSSSGSARLTVHRNNGWIDATKFPRRVESLAAIIGVGEQLCMRQLETLSLA